MATDRHRSLVERGGRKALIRDKCLAHTQKGKKGKNIAHTLKGKKGENISGKTRYSRI